jgi:hypothetical protein
MTTAQNISKIINHLHGIDKQKPLVENVDYTIDPNGESVEPLSQDFIDAMRKRSQDLLKSKGVEDMMDNPIMSAVTPSAFKSNPARKQAQQPQEAEQTDTSAKSEEKKEPVRKKDPKRTTINSGPSRILRSGDSESDVLGKMFNFMNEQYDFEKKKVKADKKYRKQLDKQKDNFLDETIEALTSKKVSGIKKLGRKVKKSGIGKYAGVGLLGLGLFAVAEKALANVDWKSMLPDFMKFDMGTGDVSELGNIIGKLESGGDYNKLVTATSGKGITPEKPLTEMTLDEISKLQDEMKKSGQYPSTAVGKYQFLQDTLKGVSKQEGLTGETKFTPEVQEQLFTRTLKNRGLEEYQSGKMSKEEFQNNLAKEYASIPVATDVHRPAGKGYEARDIKAGESYYVGVAGNKANMQSQSNIDKALERLKSPSEMTGKFGENRGSHMHGGVDFKGKLGDPVLATASGTISNVSYEAGGYGNFVEVDHGEGYKTRYAHLSKSSIKIGDNVEKGQKLGEIGSTGRSTGPHLHYEVLKDNKKVDPSTFAQTNNIKKAELEPMGYKMTSTDKLFQEMSLAKKFANMQSGTNLISTNSTTILNRGTTVQLTSANNDDTSPVVKKQFNSTQ